MVPSPCQGIEEHLELPHSLGHFSSSRCPLGAALSSPALGKCDKGSLVSDATVGLNVLHKQATAKRFAGVRTFLERLIKAHFHPVPLTEQKHLAVTSE